MIKKHTISHGYLLINLFFFGHSNALNFKKLALKQITLKNNLNKKTKIFIQAHKKCAMCTDQNVLQESIILNQNEKKQIAYHDRLITAIRPLETSTSLFITRNFMANKTLLQHTVQINNQDNNRIDKASRLNFSELDFDTLIHIATTNNAYQACVKNKASEYLTCLCPDGITVSNMLFLFKNLYEKNRFSRILPLETPKIPLIIHQVWFGITGDMPLIYKQWQKGWKKKHQEWRFICWNTNMIKDQFSQGLYNQEIFDQAHKKNTYVTMSDIARYEIIEKFGGLYTDCDSECFESFAPFHARYDFYNGLEQIGFEFPVECGMNTFGAKPGHPILQECFPLIRKNQILSPSSLKKIELLTGKNKKNSNFGKILFTDGPQLFTTAIVNKIEHDNSCNIILPNIFCTHLFKPALESFSIHHVHMPTKQQNPTYWVNQVNSQPPTH